MIAVNVILDQTFDTIESFSVFGSFPLSIPSNPEKFVRWAYCHCTDEEVGTLKDQMTHPRTHY